MNVFTKLLLYFICLLFCFPIDAQHCGMTTHELRELSQRLKANKAMSQSPLVEQRMEIDYVPITFHLVARDDGTQRVAEGDVLDQLCSLNQDFEDLDIQFYIKAFNYIDNTTLFDEHAMADTQMDNEQDPLGLDIFIFKNANNDTTLDEGITFGYFSPNKDWIVMRKDQINDRSIVLTHEMGHFFSIMHPYYGWDVEPWEEEIHGNPAPRFAPSGIRTELQDGSNCENAGDFLCDTPPDYFFAFGSNNCNYTGGAKDPNGELVDPDESNYMANFLNDCDRENYTFSPKQQEIMQVDLQSTQRGYLKTGFQPLAESISETVELLSPNQNETTDIYNLVGFTWSAAEGANQYLLEIDRLPTFAVQPIRIITANTFLEVSGLQEDIRYYWRVRPFNEYATCTASTAPNIFRTGTLSSSTVIIEDWSIFPNPSFAKNNISIKIETKRNFELEIKLFDSIGRLVTETTKVISPRTNIHTIDTPRLSAGVYIAQITVGEEHFYKKVILL